MFFLVDTDASCLDLVHSDLVRLIVEAKPGESLRFEKIKLNQSAMPLIDEQGPQLLVDVFSGRRAYKDDILACDI